MEHIKNLLTPKRKVFISVLGLAGVAMLVDRVLLAEGVTGPKSAAAGVTLSAPTTSKPNAVQPRSAPTLASRLERLRQGDTETESDAFLAPRHWLGQRTERHASTEDIAESAPPDLPLRITSIFGGSEQGQAAIINGRAFFVGGARQPLTLNGRKVQVRLISVGERSADVEADGRIIRLRLPRAVLGKTPVTRTDPAEDSDLDAQDVPSGGGVNQQR